jgi:hypothetical protein
VLDQSILGGTTMLAHEARWDLLGSGALPAAPPPGLVLADEVDVADLESEAAHGYVLGEGWDTDDQVRVQGDAPAIADGGRLHRTADRFRVRRPAGKRAALVMRVSADAPVGLVVSAGGHEAGSVPVDGDGGWVERVIELPGEAGGGEVNVVVTAQPKEVRFGSFHYWVYTEG